MSDRLRETEGWQLFEGDNSSEWDIGALEDLYGLSWLMKRFYRLFPRLAPWRNKIRYQWSPKQIEAMEKRGSKPLEINTITPVVSREKVSQEKIDRWLEYRRTHR